MPKLIKFKNKLKRFRSSCQMVLVQCLALICFGQINAQEHPLSVFEPLMGKTWKAEGTWGDGTKFKQEITFKYSLDSTLVITESKGYTNQEQTAYGHRNHGIRKFDGAGNALEFWEFDVFGGITTGKVMPKGKDLYYQYQYGDATVTDFWGFEDKNTYNFIVGNFGNGQWKQKYLETQFKALNDGFDFQFDHQSLVVKKLIETGNFYRDIMKFNEISHPDKAQGVRWFQIYEDTQLHLIKKDLAMQKRDKSVHLSVSTQNLEAVIEHLIKNDIDFYDLPGNKGSVTNRSDGIKQIYLQDPEGNWVAINTVVH